MQRRFEPEWKQPTSRPGRSAIQTVQARGSPGLVRELLYLQRAAGNAAVAERLTAVASSRQSNPGSHGAIVIQRVPLTPEDEHHLEILRKEGKKAEKLARKAKKRIQKFDTDEAVKWHFITQGLPRGPFLTNLYRELGQGKDNVAKLLEKLLDTRVAYNKEQGGVRKELTTDPPSQTKEKTSKPGGIKMLNVPSTFKLKPVTERVPSHSPQSSHGPTGGGEPKPTLGEGVFEQLADLFSLDLDAMWSTWKKTLRPDFDDYVRKELSEPYFIKAAYLALKKWGDPSEDDKVPDVEVGTVDLIEIIESDLGGQTLEKLSAHLAPKYDWQRGLEATLQEFKRRKLMYYAFGWSAAKRGSPAQEAPSPGDQEFSWLRRGKSPTTRVYLNTVGQYTEQVAVELDRGWDGQKGLPSDCQGLKYFKAGGAADRRDAIVAYVTDLKPVLDLIAHYQEAADRRNLFVDERVRLTQPARVNSRQLRGVGTAAHPEGKESFSELASRAVLKAREGAKGSPDEFQRLLPEALAEVGLDPQDPSRLLHS